MTQSSTTHEDIAIIGLSGLFPGSQDKDVFWQNILDKRDQVRIAPDSWAMPWYDPESADQGLDSARIRTRKVGLLGDLAVFNPFEFGIPPKAVEGDPSHYLALKLAGDALKDAGYDQRPFDHERTGVIVGHGSSPNRGDTLGMQHGLVVDQTLDVINQILPNLDASSRRELRIALKQSLPKLEIELAPTLISNVISGRIANRLDLMGPSYLVDSACSSSLIALDLGVQDLRSGRCDMMLIGGIQASMPAQIYMLFQQLGALARTDIRPFDANANGTLLGEGVGFAILKRLSDAMRDEDRIYAVIKGVGIASDGKAMGLLAPRLEGEVLAIRRAYEQTGIDPASIGLIEAHGTGIPLGDRTEIQTLTQVFGKRRGRLPDCALGSVKSMIGHCIPAAGMASLIKTALSLYYKTLPPTLCETVNPQLGIEATPFYINTEMRPWIHGNQSPRRAGINAFGFGGINTHAILEEYREPTSLRHSGIGRWLISREVIPPALPETLTTTRRSPQLSASVWSKWPSELFVLAADTRTELLSQAGEIVERLRQQPDLELATLACTLWQSSAHGNARLALIACDRSDLMAKLEQVLDKLPSIKSPNLASRKGIYYSEEPPTAGRTAFMFPSEGAQYPNMLADLALYFPNIRRWFDFLDEVFPRTPKPSACIFPTPTCLDDETRDWLGTQLYGGDLATESVSMASHAVYELVRELGITCDAIIGHSAGEHVALLASGKVKTRSMEEFKEKLRQLNGVYRELDEAQNVATGTLISLGAISNELLASLLQEFEGSLHLVADNCPNQVILFVTQDFRDTVVARIRQSGGIYAEMPFDRAYHTPLFHAGSEALRRFYEEAIETDSGSIAVYSCSTTQSYPEKNEEILDVAARQWEKPVRFRETVEALYEDGVRTFVEIGPSSSLTAFVDSILKGKDYLAVATNAQGRPALEQLQHMLGRLYAHKATMDLTPLYEHRNIAFEQQSDRKSGNQARGAILNGDLPRLSLPPDFSFTLEIEKTGNAQTAGASMDSATLAPGQALEALKIHFDLMQKFLENQTRVSEMVGHHLNETQDAKAQGPSVL